MAGKRKTIGAWVLVFIVAGGSTAIGHGDTRHGDFAGLIDIGGGRRLYLPWRGTGDPTVFLEAGLRVRSDYWSENSAKPPAASVLPGVAAFTHVCAYDRPGTVIGTAIKDRSRSDPIAMPRSAIGAVDDLHALLRAAHIPLPVVLAGHSTGGLLIRMYAQIFSREVAGLVLIDALPDGLQRNLTPAQYATFLQLNTQRPKDLQSYIGYETIPFDPAFAQLRRLQKTKPLRPMPLVVVSRGVPVTLPGSVPAGFSKALERAWRIQQANLVKLEPGAQHIIATRSEHYIMLEQPALVVRAIRNVVDAVRNGATRPFGG